MTRRLLPIPALLALALVATAPAAAERVALAFTVAGLADERVVEVDVAAGDFRGRWRLELKGAAPAGLRPGTRGTLAADRSALEAGRGRGTVRFKGTDEELQALFSRAKPRSG